MIHSKKVAFRRMGELEKKYGFDRENGTSQLPESPSPELLINYGRYDAYRHIYKLFLWSKQEEKRYDRTTDNL